MQKKSFFQIKSAGYPSFGGLKLPQMYHKMSKITKTQKVRFSIFGHVSRKMEKDAQKCAHSRTAVSHRGAGQKCLSERLEVSAANRYAVDSNFGPHHHGPWLNWSV